MLKSPTLSLCAVRRSVLGDALKIDIDENPSSSGFGIEDVAVCQELFDEIVEVVKLLFVKIVH